MSLFFKKVFDFPLMNKVLEEKGHLGLDEATVITTIEGILFLNYCILFF